MNGVIDLSKVREAKAAPKDGDGEDGLLTRVYNFYMTNGEMVQAYGYLMITPSFFACGTAADDEGSVNFTFVAPPNQVQYIIPDDEESELAV